MTRIETDDGHAERTSALPGASSYAGRSGHLYSLRRRALAPVRSFPILVGMILTVVILIAVVPKLVSGPEILSIFNQIAPLALIAMGLSIALSASALDISVAQVSDTTAVVSGLLLAARASLWETILIALAVGLAVGVVNGIISSWIGISSLITTLSMTFLLEGIELILTHGGAATTLFSLTGSAPVEFANLGQGTVGPLSFSLLIASGVAIVLLLVERFSVLGREVRLVGQNLAAARAIGIQVRRRFATALVMSGVVGAIAGIMVLGTTGIAAPGSGSNYLVGAFAAAYLGGLAGRRARFGVLEACFGALYVSVLAAGLTLMGAGAAAQDLVEGLLLVVAIGLNRLRSRA